MYLGGVKMVTRELSNKPIKFIDISSRAVVIYTLHRGQRDTRLYPLISYRSLLCTLTSAPSWEFLFTYLRHYSSPFLPVVAAAASCAPARSFPTFSHHCIPNHAPGALSDPSHRSNSGRVAMYCATIFYHLLMYSPIVKNHASLLSVTATVYCF